MALVGRDDDLDAILFTLRHAQGVLIVGESGVGKTALAAAAAAALPQPPLARIVATAAGRSVPFGALAPLLGDDESLTPALVPVRIAERLERGQGSAARRSSPPVLLIDDLHELDGPSAAALLSLVVSDSIRLLATARSGHSVPDAVTALWKEGLVRRVDLSPLDRAQTALLLADLLGAPVASPTAAALHALSAGNPLHLTELARFGRSRDRFVLRGDRWWWTPGGDVPPRLGELLRARIDSLSEAGRELAELLALGEPLPYDALAETCDPSALDELDRAGLIEADEQHGVVTLRFSHSLLQSVTEATISRTRRRVLSRRLQSTFGDQVDVVRQATWQLAGGGEPRLQVLLAAADVLMVSDPDAAERFARRAAEIDHGSAAMVALAHIHAERGDVAAAQATLVSVADRISGDQERFEALLEELSECLWLTRDAAAARATVQRMRAQLPSAFEADVTSTEALALLFTGHPSEALRRADEVLSAAPERSPRVRALTARLAALCFGDRGDEALVVADRLEHELSDWTLPATRASLIAALIGTTRLIHGLGIATPSAVGAMGRWPEPQSGGAPVEQSSADVGWPLLAGMRRHLAGDLEGALDPLREALVQQRAGEGVFRSEAAAELIVVLCELNRLDEAETLFTASPPDQIAIIPGLSDWSAAAIAGAGLQRQRASSLAIAAAESAVRGGAELMAWVFLADAGRWGVPDRAAQARRELGLQVDSAAARARSAAIDARATNRPGDLVAAAKLQLAQGFFRHAIELAEASQGTSDGAAERSVGRAAAAVLATAYEHVGTRSSMTPRTVRLTAREAEVSRLAARGYTDREIADRLTVSIRTVNSHLASVYRKLGIASRAELQRSFGST